MDASMHFTKHTYFGIRLHFASERSKHAKLTEGEPNMPKICF